MGVKVHQRKDKPGWWVTIHHKGQRKKKSFGSNKALANEFARKLEARLKLGEVGISVKAGLTLKAYTTTWLEHIQHTRKPSTRDDYGKRLEHDIFPLLGSIDLQDVTRERVKALALAGMKKGQAPKTVQNTLRVLSSLLSHAKEDGLITENTALRPGKILPKVSKRRAIEPLTREEVAIFLNLVKMKAPRFHPIFLCTVRTGLRQGELLALQWEDLNFQGRFIEVRRNFTHGELTTPKSGESRRVDMSLELTQTLKDLQIDRQLEAVTRQWKEVSPWVFCDEHGAQLRHNPVRLTFHQLLKAAGVRRVRFHDLRHTFASLLLQQGESPVYVKEQMGHSSIQVTVDLYGHLIPGGNKQAVDRLDGPAENRVPERKTAPQAHPSHAREEQQEAEAVESTEKLKRRYGVSDGFRTRDLRIHNPAL